LEGEFMAGDGTLFQRKQGSKCYLIINTGEKDEKGVSGRFKLPHKNQTQRRSPYG
jgi:hypothetical protein